MNKISVLLGLTALVIGVAVLAPQAVQAYQGDPKVQRPNCTTEQHIAIEKAIESNNYTQWKQLMAGKGRVTQMVNENNFAKFAEMHRLMDQGKTTEANKLKTELGLGLHNGTGRGQGMGRWNK
jgi:hypothetical protein